MLQVVYSYVCLNNSFLSLELCLDFAFAKGEHKRRERMK